MVHNICIVFHYNYRRGLEGHTCSNRNQQTDIQNDLGCSEYFPCRSRRRMWLYSSKSADRPAHHKDFQEDHNTRANDGPNHNVHYDVRPMCRHRRNNSTQDFQLGMYYTRPRSSYNDNLDLGSSYRVWHRRDRCYDDQEHHIYPCHRKKLVCAR